MSRCNANGPQPDGFRQIVCKSYAEAAARAATVAAGRRSASCTPHSGLGCGSPTVFANFSPGERVLDLGSGAGFDCLAAAVEVGRRGRVVGVDMTPEMVRLARRHAAGAGVGTVDFLQAEIESLPFPDASFDVVMSNCVINLCADKTRVLAEAWRVLAPGGRLVVADIVAVAPLPERILGDLALHTGCVAGATPCETLVRTLTAAGFTSIAIDVGGDGAQPIDAWAPHLELSRFIAAASITARK